MEAERSRMLDFKRAIFTLDASVAIQQVQTLEGKVRQLRAEVDRIADSQGVQQRAAPHPCMAIDLGRLGHADDLPAPGPWLAGDHVGRLWPSIPRRRWAGCESA
jgi:hypothetical protein